ncbi:hypothetical protein MGYG_02237 [Nannizzia gypsea CBS 118893]|uniref:Uncharacterized protein n=1 Tax=Arthroderma gypseum (strain ATCC MYA-4604 / CBS 118893) TaxID=535722 RepID=E4UQJ4_ARTGP|nr:hypothetical protein MGYG_02237 [Nannizzia gypsea CBS 118893]EFQ99223.1 hypothetical protein MGYG_02237 [Nannizzia gypsea CBS 118893]
MMTPQPFWFGVPTLAFVLITLQHSSLVESASSIATFSDENCQDSLSSFDGPNGYPNGTCSRLDRSGKYGSFQAVNLDDGCSVTLYGRDDIAGQPCSSSVVQVAEIAACYNSSWIFYSIDECTAPAPGQTKAPVPDMARDYTGAIVGSTIGGLFVIAIFIIIGWFCFVYRPCRKQNECTEQATGHVKGAGVTYKKPAFGPSDSPGMTAGRVPDTETSRDWRVMPELEGSQAPIEMEARNPSLHSPSFAK